MRRRSSRSSSGLPDDSRSTGNDSSALRRHGEVRRARRPAPRGRAKPSSPSVRVWIGCRLERGVDEHLRALGHDAVAGHEPRYISRILRYRAMSGSDLTTRPATRRERRATRHRLGGSWAASPFASRRARSDATTALRAGRRRRRRRGRPRRRPARDRPMPSSSDAGSQPTTSTRSTVPPRPASMPSTTAGFMLWASSAGAASSLGRRLDGELGLDHGDRAGASPIGTASTRTSAS